MIIGFNKDGEDTWNALADGMWIDEEQFLKHFTFLDGTPCGEKVEC